VLFVCCVLLYNHCHRVKTHLQLYYINRTVFLDKYRTRDNVQNIIVVLMYHRHKLLDLIYISISSYHLRLCFPSGQSPTAFSTKTLYALVFYEEKYVNR
jgi:hypothetical protein